MDLNIPYDTDSIMQYTADVGTKDDATGPAMLSLDLNHPIPVDLVEDRRLSPLDVLSVQRLYNCTT